MRPPDENQPGSTRPNFTSSARRSASGDDNILARLERDARRGRVGKQGWKHARLAWCLLASVAVIGLVGTLASLTRENLSVNRPPVLIEARSTPPEISAPSAAALVKGGFAPLPAPDLKLAAAVLDLPPEPVKLPPMVMLKPAPETAPAKPAAVRAPDPAPTPKPAVKSTPAKPAAKAPPVKVAVVKPAPVRPVVAVAAPPRPKKPAAATTVAQEPAVVDSDVALLSAIIMHANRHSAERAQQEAARCGAGKKCAPPNDPLTTPLKATD